MVVLMHTPLLHRSLAAQSHNSTMTQLRTHLIVISVGSFLIGAACTGEHNGSSSVSTKDNDKTTSSLGTLTVSQDSANSKLEGQSKRVLESINPDEVIAIIVRVNQENYVPDGIIPSVQITPYLFTARIQSNQLEQLQDNVHVNSIEFSQILPGQ